MTRNRFLLTVIAAFALLSASGLAHARTEDALTSDSVAAPRHGRPAIDPERTAFIFIEFQQEWIGENATLTRMLVKDQQAVQDAARAAKSVLTAARARGWHVVHAGLDLSSDPSYLVFGRGENKLGLRQMIPQLKTWQQHGAQFMPPFVPEPDEYIVRGRTGGSALTNSTLDAYLRNNGIDTIVLLGFATHVCVESTLRHAHDMGYNVFVATDAVAAFERQQQEYFEKHVLHHFGAGITSNELMSLMQADQPS
jgi:nicotinamidase-related amidase